MEKTKLIADVKDTAASETYAKCICTTDVGNIDWVLVGFPGNGLVGSIAAKQIITHYNLEWIGSIKSPLIPPVSVFLEGKLTYPYRIFGNKDKNFMVFLGESPAPINAYYHIANAALDFLESLGAKEVVCLDGVPKYSPDEETEVFVVAEPELIGNFTKFGFKIPETGYISGMSGAILNESLLRPIDGYALLVNTFPQFPDPEGAAALVENINKVKGLDVPVDNLLKEAAQIKEKLREFAERTNKMQEEPTYPTPTRGVYV